MAKKAKKVSKAAKIRLVKAAEALENFSDNAALGDVLNITETYKIKKDASPLTFNLIFKTKGVGAVTNGVLHDALTDIDTPVVTNAKDSIRGQLIETDLVANRKFLNIHSVIAATNLTSVPADLDAQFSISGGVKEVIFPIPGASFNEVGDQVILDISIFFF